MKEQPDSYLVCQCNDVSKGELCAAISQGKRKLMDLQQATNAGSVCGSCRPDCRAARRPRPQPGHASRARHSGHFHCLPDTDRAGHLYATGTDFRECADSLVLAETLVRQFLEAGQRLQPAGILPAHGLPQPAQTLAQTDNRPCGSLALCPQRDRLRGPGGTGGAHRLPPRRKPQPGPDAGIPRRNHDRSPGRSVYGPQSPLDRPETARAPQVVVAGALRAAVDTAGAARLSHTGGVLLLDESL
ncbi:(2Fe-2S)-binding protein [Microbulbifer taiwanensis]|uniref:(2Fe-2S)-binding protein n=1 Tax=Microbulbifer taiwanensis TaxID=986746 RepID=UPI003611B8C4